MAERKFPCDTHSPFFIQAYETTHADALFATTTGESSAGNKHWLEFDKNVLVRKVEGPRTVQIAAVFGSPGISEFFGGYKIDAWQDRYGYNLHSHLEFYPFIEEDSVEYFQGVYEKIPNSDRLWHVGKILKSLPTCRISKDHGIEFMKEERPIVYFKKDNDFFPKEVPEGSRRRMNSRFGERDGGFEYVLFDRLKLPDLQGQRTIYSQNVQYVLRMRDFPPDFLEIDQLVKQLGEEDSEAVYGRIRDKVDLVLRIDNGQA